MLAIVEALNAGALAAASALFDAVDPLAWYGLRAAVPVAAVLTAFAPAAVPAAPIFVAAVPAAAVIPGFTEAAALVTVCPAVPYAVDSEFAALLAAELPCMPEMIPVTMLGVLSHL